MSKRKKIIFSCFDDLKNPNYGGGGSYAIHQISKRLTKQHDVTVITGAYNGSVDEVIDGVRYRRIGFSKFGGRVGQLIFQILLPYYVLTSKYDVWFENFTPPISTGFLPLFTKKPVVGVANLLAAKDMSKKYWGIPFHVIEKFGLKFYKNVIVLTKYLQQKLASQYLNMNIHLIPNAVEDEYIKYNVNEKSEDFILFLGRIDVEQKGIDLLLTAYKKIENKVNQKLIIAGDGPPEELRTLKKLIKKLDLADKIEIKGWVSGKEKVDLLKNAAYMVLPSRFEEFGIVVLESFCFETPVITFDLPQLTWIPKEGVIKVESKNTDDLAKEMLKMSTDHISRRRMGKSAKKTAAEYSWDRSAKLYEEVIKKSGGNKNSNNVVLSIFKSYI